MLDISQIKETTEKAIEFYKVAFGLRDWRISVEYGIPKAENPELIYAQVDAIYERQRATILINPTMFTDEEQLLETIRHEMFHLITSPVSMLYNFLPEQHQALIQYIEESIIRGLERMYEGMLQKGDGDGQA